MPPVASPDVEDPAQRRRRHVTLRKSIRLVPASSPRFAATAALSLAIVAVARRSLPSLLSHPSSPTPPTPPPSLPGLLQPPLGRDAPRGTRNFTYWSPPRGVVFARFPSGESRHCVDPIPSTQPLRRPDSVDPIPSTPTRHRCHVTRRRTLPFARARAESCLLLVLA